MGDLKRAMARELPTAAFVRAVGELVGTTVDARLRGVQRDARASEGGVAVVLARADSPSLRSVIVEVEPALASALVSRALRRTAPRVIDPNKAATEPIAGAVAAILVAAARRASAPLKVIAAGSSQAILAAHAGARSVAASFTVMVEYDAFVAQLIVSAEAAAASPPLAWDTEALRSLGELRLGLPIVAACSRSTAAEIAALRVGDVWLSPSTLRKTSEGWTGEVLLVAAAAERGLRGDLAAGGRVVLREGDGRLGWTADEGDMVDKDALLESVGEVPVIVRVEIGVAELSARAWSAVGAGDVIALGRRVGEPVVLRVSGVEVARGELVEIEGEVGVRVTHRTGGS